MSAYLFNRFIIGKKPILKLLTKKKNDKNTLKRAEHICSQSINLSSKSIQLP